MKLLIVILSMLLFSCKAFEKSETYISKADTIIRIVETEITVPVFTETIIESPCDSNGILKDFKSTINTKKGNVVVFSKNNELHAVIEQKADTCIDEFNYISKDSVSETNVLKVKTIYPRWLIGLCAVLVCIIVVLIKIKTWL